MVPAKPCDLAVGWDEMVRILVTDLASGKGAYAKVHVQCVSP